MFYKSRNTGLVINRNTLIAATPIFFLLLLALWTLLNINVSPVKAQPLTNTVVAVVKRSNANLREGPGTQYRIVGKSLSGATLSVIGRYDNKFGQRWYKVYLRALGDVWVSGTVVTISPTNADIPVVDITQENGLPNTALPPTPNNALPASGSNTSNNGNTGNSGGNNPPNSPQQPTSVPQQPATTPDPNP